MVALPSNQQYKCKAVVYVDYWHWTASIKALMPPPLTVQRWLKKGWDWATDYGKCFTFPTVP